MTKWASCIICLLCCLLSFAFITPARAADSIKIGALLSLTGPGAMFGQPQKDAFLAMVADVNQKGGVLGRPIDLIIEDDKSTPTNAVIAATKLIKDHNVCAILGATMTDSGAAIIPIVEREGVSMLVTGPLATPFKKWVFLIGPGDSRGAAHSLDFVVNKFGAKRIGILRDTSAYGVQGSKYYHEYIKNYPGASIIAEEKMEYTDTNVIPQLSNLKAANPDMILLHTFATPASVVAKNYKQLGLKIPVHATSGVPNSQFLKLAGSIAEENKWIMTAADIVVAEKMPMTDPWRKNVYEPFKKLMKDKYGPDKEINPFHASTYDAFWVALLSIKAAGTDNRAAVRDAIENLRFDGMMRLFACTPTDHQGTPVDTMPQVTVRNGEYVFYQK